MTKYPAGTMGFRLSTDGAVGGETFCLGATDVGDVTSATNTCASRKTAKTYVHPRRLRYDRLRQHLGAGTPLPGT